MSSERKTITALPRDLLAQGYGPTNYRRVYNAVVAGTVPAQQESNGRWTYSPADVPQIGQALGLAADVAA